MSNWRLLSVTRFYWVFTGFHWFWMDITGFYLVLPSFIFCRCHVLFGRSFSYLSVKGARQRPSFLFLFPSLFLTDFRSFFFLTAFFFHSSFSYWVLFMMISFGATRRRFLLFLPFFWPMGVCVLFVLFLYFHLYFIFVTPQKFQRQLIKIVSLMPRGFNPSRSESNRPQKNKKTQKKTKEQRTDREQYFNNNNNNNNTIEKENEKKNIKCSSWIISQMRRFHLNKKKSKEKEKKNSVMVAALNED